MSQLALNRQLSFNTYLLGNEKVPLLVVDDLVNDPELLRHLAQEQGKSNLSYTQQSSDYYPGIRKAAPKEYRQNVLKPLFAKLSAMSAMANNKQINIVLSAFSIATTPPEALRPIQMLPHFDSPADNQYAVVHYLCEPHHGGTSIYRHKSSGFERITTNRLAAYRNTLKRQAQEQELHKNPDYISGSTTLFEQIFSVEAKMNRAVLYPSNVLHSGDIRPETGLSSCPRQGRLTISSFITTT